MKHEVLPCPFLIRGNKGIDDECRWFSRLNSVRYPDYDPVCRPEDQADYVAYGPPATGHVPLIDPSGRMKIIVVDCHNEQAKTSRCPWVNIHAGSIRYRGGDDV